jgi:farnesyl-diphosphate farnesyltransferase
VIDDCGKKVLKGVSRSFYLSLCLLPAPMRAAASLGYLLARTSDTLADSAAVPLDARREALDLFQRCIAGQSDFSRWSNTILGSVSDSSEYRLLNSSQDILEWLHELPEQESCLVREVLGVIISGQSLDLERFAQASKHAPVSLRDDKELEDYAWRVAGCVGGFWTKLGFLTLGGDFSKSSESELIKQGIAYGKGLQLVNILRDVTADLAVGRCYLPVADPQDSVALMICHRQWLIRAAGWLDEGVAYAERLPIRRLRASSILPALLAKETLSTLQEKSWNELQTRIKIPRSAVYRCLIQALFVRPVES